MINIDYLYQFLFYFNGLARKICSYIIENPYIQEKDIEKLFNISKYKLDDIFFNVIFIYYNVSSFWHLKIILLIKNHDITKKTMLSTRELENIKYLLKGYSISDIAKKRGLTISTIKSQIQRCKEKYKLDDICNVIIKIFEVQDGLKTIKDMYIVPNLSKFNLNNIK
ncbi:MAG: helix-turn-helix domain-containing protein [Deltaproteobacteria bacterium]|jgi:DNA-binding CsgD family transcriptional regulator|nr:helix-turn-helix domain-containing protein [Deltaproteobacteria bacterium]